MKTTVNKKLSKLFAIAEAQNGYFSAKQAEKVGFLPTNYTYHVNTGSWVRETRGVYRLQNFPQSEVGQYILYSLWSRDRDDKPQGVYSHQTALSIYELSDLMPTKIHMTVPKSFRKWAKTPKVLQLHFENLNPKDVTEKSGFKVMKPLPTILMLLKEGEVSREFIEQAFVQGVRRGLISINEIASSAIPKDTKTTLNEWLKSATGDRR